jgi:protocatechuate 3,4-dioxygenase beta subunit
MTAKGRWIALGVGLATTLLLAVWWLVDERSDGPSDGRLPAPPLASPDGSRPQLPTWSPPEGGPAQGIPLDEAPVDAAKTVVFDGQPEHGFTGHVLDHRGEPVADARVSFVPAHPSWHAAGADVWLGKQVDASRLPSTTTDAHGRFSLRGPHASVCPHDIQPGSFWAYVPALLVDADGYAIHPHGCPGYGGGDYEAGVLRVEPEARVRGRLVDEGGEPLEGLDVIAVTEELRPAHLERSLVPYSDYDDVLEVLHRATSGADGAFTIDGLWEGALRVVVEGDQVRTLVVEDVQPRSGTTLDLGDLAVTAGLPLAGRVVDEGGQPIAGAEVFVVQQFGRWAELEAEAVLLNVLRADGDRRSLRARTDALGRFSVGRLEQHALYTVFVRAPRYEPATATRVFPDAGELELVLPAATRMEISVQSEPTGERLPDARVEAVRVLDDHSRRELRLPVEPVQGSGVPTHWIWGPGRYKTRLVIGASGHGTRLETYDGIEPGAVREVSVVLPAGHALSGQVRDTSGRPIPGATVAVREHWSLSKVQSMRRQGKRPKGLRLLPWVTTDAEGGFEVGGLSPRGWDVAVWADGFLEQIVRVVVREDARTLQDVVLVPEAIVEGLVTGLDGLPAAGSRVMLEQAIGATRRMAPVDDRVADPQGHYRFDGLAAGTYRVNWRRDARVAVKAGETARVDLQERVRPIIRGRVLADGTTRLGARVFAPWWIDEFGDERRDSVDPETERGLYHVELPGPGRVALHASDRVLDRMSALVEVDVGWGEERVVDLHLGRGRVTGAIVDATSGEPVEGARVMLGTGEGLPFLGQAVSDVSGGFVLKGVAPGSYLLRLFHPKYLLRNVEPVAVPDEGDVDLGRLAIERSSVMSITLLDPQGDQAAVVTLFVVDERREALVATYLRTPGPSQRPPIHAPGRFWALALPGRHDGSDAWREHAQALVPFELRAGEQEPIEITVLR